MNYEEVITIVNKNPDESFIGISLSDDNFLSVYTVMVADSEDPDYVSIHFEGGDLFSLEGEEDFYEIDEAPEEIKNLHFKNTNAFPDISEYTAEYILHKLFPELPDPGKIRSKSEQLNFAKSAKECINKKWKVI